MSSYRSLIIVTLVFIFIGCSHKTYLSKQPNPQEDINILLALDSEKKRDHQDAIKYYANLYDMTKEEIYLKKVLYNSYQAGDFSSLEKFALEGIENFDKMAYTYEYILAISSQKKFVKALRIAKDLLKEFQTPEHYELVANLYYQQKNYKESLKYYESAYADNQNDSTLLKLVNILYSYLDKKEEALAYLETYVQTNDCKPSICNKLMLIYQEQGNIDGMLSILNKMYVKYKKEPIQLPAIQAIENLIISLLEKKDIKKAIEFLEKNDLDKDKLINLYYQNGQLDKALALTKQIYKETKNPELLGKIAMYRFELAEDKRAAMKHVIANFELALSSGINNAAYQNYYGYLLIDYDIDVPKGIELVKQALSQSPNNIAYLDSLAWGYYKVGECDKSKEIMQRVVDAIGLNDPEIKLHWNVIKDCKGKNSNK